MSLAPLRLTGGGEERSSTPLHPAQALRSSQHRDNRYLRLDRCQKATAAVTPAAIAAASFTQSSRLFTSMGPPKPGARALALLPAPLSRGSVLGLNAEDVLSSRVEVRSHDRMPGVGHHCGDERRPRCGFRVDVAVHQVALRL